jgi:hypothetical protein
MGKEKDHQHVAGYNPDTDSDIEAMIVNHGEVSLPIAK